MENSEKKTLVTLASNMGTILAEIMEAGGELSPKIEAMLADVGTDLARKTDSYVMVMDKLESEEEFWKKKAEAFAAVAKGCARVREQMKERIKMAVELTGEDEVRGDDFRFKLSPSAPKLIIDPIALPAEYTMVVTTRTPDNQRIKAALEAGTEIAGAKLQPTKSLRKYVNKKGT